MLNGRNNLRQFYKYVSCYKNIGLTFTFAATTAGAGLFSGITLSVLAGRGVFFVKKLLRFGIEPKKPGPVFEHERAARKIKRTSALSL